MLTSGLRDVAILVIDDEAGMRNFLQRVLQKDYGLIETAANLSEADNLRKRCHFDLIILDNRLPNGSGAEWLQHLRKMDLDTEVILITGYGDMDVAISAVRGGASDFLLKPFHADDIKQSVERCLTRRTRNRQNFLSQQAGRFSADSQISTQLIGETAGIKQLNTLIQRIAPTQSTVLITGETGTGKELVAQSIHELSKRPGPFVPVNCGSISPELLESELFGHAKGAFTGAYSAHQGLCYYADNGTLFLDEIGEMPLPMQAKLLRMLESHAIRPVGAERETRVDCRIVAATNLNLADQVERGGFRKDLYYRLNVVTLHVPALRDRLSDLPLLTRYLIDKLSAEFGIPPYPVTSQDIRYLQNYYWPGNVRELRNILERTLLLGQLPVELLSDNQDTNEDDAEFMVPNGWTLREVERRYLLDTLQFVDGNKSEAARRLGISRKTIERKLNEWDHDTIG